MKYYSDFKMVSGQTKGVEAVHETREVEGPVEGAPVDHRSGNQSSGIFARNEYSSDFDLFEKNSEVADVLAKVRSGDDRGSASSTRLCFTPLVILMEKSVLLPLRSQVRLSSM